MPFAAPPGIPPAADTVVYRSARSLLAGLRAGEFSANELLEAHLSRIEAVNPAVNAIVTLDPDGARRAAACADRRRAAGEPLGPLHGLPVAFKDTHATAGMRTTYGSPRHADLVPDHDEEIVRRIGQAGAIRIGKTNVPEFAAGSHTYNEVFGTTGNPWATDRSAGGSSGGAAAALASGLQPIADGSDMGGSLRNPASFCGVVGLRPTPGRVPSPESPFGWATLSVSGPMGRTVDDVALLLSAIAGPHRDAPLSLPGGPLPDAVRPADLRGMRLAWAPTLGDRVPVDPAVLAVLQPVVAAAESAGAVIDDACTDLDGADEAFRTMRAAGFATRWGEELASEPDTFKPDLAWNIRCGLELSGRQVMRADAEITRLYRTAAAFFDSYDALLAPVSQVPPFDAALRWPQSVDGVRQHTYLDWMASCYLITTLGTPAMSVPAGTTADGLPVGLQIVTAAWTEQRLLAIAAAFEQLSV